VSAVEWAEANWVVPESGRRIVLRAWQKAALTAMFPADGSPSRWETFLLSNVKKSGKTELDSVAVMYATVTTEGETAFVVANDLAQAQDRVFDRISRQVRLNGMVARGEAIVTKSEIVFPALGSRIVAVPADFAGAAGAIFGVSSWTELWAFRYEEHVRLWEELTPIPNRRSLRIVDSYAGFAGDSPILEPMWSRALGGERLDDELPVFSNGKLWAFIDQGEEAQERAWLGDPADRESYYEEQRATLRPGTFSRLHLNKWQSGSESYVTAEDWDAITSEYTVPHLEPSVRAYVGVDVGTKQDCSAVVAVGWDESGLLAVIAHRIWVPPRGGTLDLKTTVEAYVHELRWRFGALHVVFDPSQMIRSGQELEAAGIPMLELPQTIPNLTAATGALYAAVKEQYLRCYPAPDLRSHVLNSVVVESARGWRLAKEKASRKIDAVVALSFAVWLAVQGPRGTVSKAPPITGGLPISQGLREMRF
jgi:phage terminase large subunit-like protein